MRMTPKIALLLVVGILSAEILYITTRSANSYGMTAYLNHTTWTRLLATIMTENPAENPKLPRILCWILTDPKLLDTRAVDVRDTWAKHCDRCLFMSSKANATFPTIGLNVSSGRNHLAAKSKMAWTYVHLHHRDDADYFVKADDDTFLLVDNLKRYLAKRDPNVPEFFGHRMYMHVNKRTITYNSGGTGQILSKRSLQLLVEKGYANKSYDCMMDGQGEDWKTAWCLTLAGAHTVDTRDAEGRMTFMIFHIDQHFPGGMTPQWHKDRVTDDVPKSYKCCSQYPISFHYVSGREMRKLYYYVYELKHAGTQLTSLADNDKFTFIKPDGHEKKRIS